MLNYSKLCLKGLELGIKENLDAVKKEIGTEEQFLEGIIKGERFFKKYKKVIIISLSLIVVVSMGYAVINFLNNKRIEESNKAYLALVKNPNDKEALSTLKEKNERLYNFYRFKLAIDKSDKNLLKELENYSIDFIISDLSSYELAGLENKTVEKSLLLKEFVYLQNGFIKLKNNNIGAAKEQFVKIGFNSPLESIIKNLEHYQGESAKEVKH